MTKPHPSVRFEINALLARMSDISPDAAPLSTSEIVNICIVLATGLTYALDRIAQYDGVAASVGALPEDVVLDASPLEPLAAEGVTLRGARTIAAAHGRLAMLWRECADALAAEKTTEEIRKEILAANEALAQAAHEAITEYGRPTRKPKRTAS